MADNERDSLIGRASRVARVGAGLSQAGLAYGAERLFVREGGDARSAKALRAALGGVKGPLMKVAQMLATVPDLLPPEYAEELAELQTNAPAMGRSFVKRRMKAELGSEWRQRFSSFEDEAAHAASLGQVHRAVGLDGRALAVKLQYPDMASAVEADLAQLQVLLGLFKRLERAIDPSEIAGEVGDRLREELDYDRERKAMDLYRTMLSGTPEIAIPEPIPELSTGRLLTMTWLEGAGLKAHLESPQETRNRIARLLFRAWWSPMGSHGVIHGDPHLGNYAVVGSGEGLNLLDFGCIRIFPVRFVEGVVTLYRALRADDREAQALAYESWGFGRLDGERIEALNLWARFIYGPILEDRARTIADGVSPAEYGRREAFAVRNRLRELGPLRIPREFVFMDRAAIGLGAAFLHLRAELNFHQLFEEAIQGFSAEAVAARQAAALGEAGLA